MQSKLKVFFEDESGGTAIEYGLIAALVAAALIAAFAGLGDGLEGLFSGNGDSIGAALKGS